MSKPKIAITLSVVGLSLAAVLSIPLPLHIEATFIIQPLNGGDVYTQSPGELIDLRVEPGQKVKGPVLDEEGNEVEPGEVLLILYSPEKEDERRDLELKIKLQEIEERTQAKKNQSGRMHLAQQRIRAFRNQLAEVNDQIEDLTIRATVDGTIVAAPRTPEPPIETRRRQLTTWNGTPLSNKNIGATLDERTHLLSIAPNASYQAIMLIDQGDVNEMIQDGFAERLMDQQENNEVIQLKFDHLASRTYEGEIVEVSQEIMEYVPELLSNKLGGELPTVTDSQGREKLLSSVYQATIELSDDTQLLRSGMRGRARFRVDERTAWAWIWRYLQQTFHFRL